MDKKHVFSDYTFIVLASVFGAGSILLLAIGGSKTYIDLKLTGLEILVWDTFLSFLFFIQHSGMVRKTFKDRLDGIFPHHYQIAVYAISSGIVLIILIIFWQRSETDLIILQGVPRFIANMFSLLGALIFIVSASSLRPFDPLGIGPIRAHLRAIKYKPGPFVIRGPYKWVRHPLYFCVLLMFWSNPDVTADRLLFNILWTAWVYFATILEERDLSREFGDSYLQYQKTVPMLIPWKISRL